MPINGFPSEFNNVVSPSYLVVNAEAVLTNERIGTAGNTLTINTTSSQTMDGTASGGITSSTQYHYIEFMSDGANWMIKVRNFS